MSDAPTPPATPEAAILADEHGIDLTTLSGSGQDGRVLVSDVEAALKTAEPPSGVRLDDDPAGLTFKAPRLAGGSTVTLRPGERVSPALIEHVPDALRSRLIPA